MKTDPLWPAYVALIERRGPVPLAWLLRHSPDGDVAAATANAWNASEDSVLMRAVAAYASDDESDPGELTCFDCHRFGVGRDCPSCVAILRRGFDTSRLAVLAPRLLGVDTCSSRA